MTISEVHLREFAREILLRVLQEGIVPSGEELARLTELRTEGLDMSQPEFSQGNPGVEYGEEASASKFNKLSREIVAGLKVLYNGYLEGERHLVESRERTLLEMQRLSRKVKSLISRVNRLLLTEEKTGGLLNTVGDNFIDMSLIDETRTTSHIDLEGQSVHGEYFRQSHLDPLDSIDLRRIPASAISVTPLDPRVRRAPGTRDSTVLDIFKDSEQPWIYTVSTDFPEPVPVEVRINFDAAADPALGLMKTYKIVLDPFVTNNSLLVIVQHSIDGTTWKDLPVTEPLRRIQGPTVYLVDGIEFRYLRIVMTRDIHTRLGGQGEYFHDFGIRRLAVHSVGNIYVPESELVSRQHIVLDENGDRKKFTKASLSVACEQIEADTEIDYFIAFLDSNLNEGEFQRVLPLNREATSGPRIAEASAVTLAATPTEIDTTTPAFPGDVLSENFLLEGSVTAENPEVWRNVGANHRYYSTRQEDGRVVEEGWTYDGANYKCYIYINQLGGQDFDFGPRPIEIDGVSLTGEVRLSEGVHVVKVKEENWYSLEGLGAVSDFDQNTKQFRGRKTDYGEEGFTINIDDAPNIDVNYRVIDPLFPYNHKLLIEGLSYAPNFSTDVVRQKYKGAARYAAYLSKRIADVDMEHGISALDYGKHAIVRADDGVGGVVSRVMVKWNEVEGELPREQFLVIEKTSDAFAEGLVFKAIFKTTNPRRSASLEGYEIKIAE